MRLGLGLSLGGRSGGTSSTITQLRALLDGQSDCSIHDFTQATLVSGTTFTSTSISTGGGSFTQATGANRPGISGTLGATFDGGDLLLRTIAGGTYTVVLALTKGTSTDGRILTDQGAAEVLRYVSGDASATYTGLTVNGASVTTKGGLFTALDGAGERIITFTNAALTGDTSIGIGRTAGGLLGSVRRAVVISNAQVTGASLTSATSLAATWVAQS